MAASGGEPSADSSPISSTDSDSGVTSAGSCAGGGARAAHRTALPDKCSSVKSHKGAKAKDIKETNDVGDTDEGILREMVSFTLV